MHLKWLRGVRQPRIMLLSPLVLLNSRSSVLLRCASILLVIGTLVTPLSGANRAVAPSNSQYEAIPLVRSRQNHLLVRASINGRSAWLGVDTGAPVSAIAVHRREHFKIAGIATNPTLPSRIQINGTFNNVGIIRTLRLGGLELVDEPVVLVDLKDSARSTRFREEQEIDGILGADVLLPTKAVLDCQRRILFLKADPDVVSNVPAFDHRGFQAVPMEVSDGFNLYVDGSINGAPAKFMVDTGSFATLLHRSFVRRMKIPTQETPFQSAAVNLKRRGVRLAHIRKLSVGSVNFIGKDVGVVDLEGLIHGRLLQGSPPVAGLLGAEILNKNHGVIDFGSRTLYLKRESESMASRDRSPEYRVPRAKPIFP
jgi:predicted aspartyl protease